MWHFSHGKPYHQPTMGLFFVFAVSAALFGLLSVWAVLGALEWTKRLPVFLVATAALVGSWLLFIDWEPTEIWGMVTIGLAEMACLIFVLGLLRLFGVAIRHEWKPQQNWQNTVRFSIYDLLVVTSSVAILSAVLGASQSSAIGTQIYSLTFAGGTCAAFVTLSTLWVAFGKSSLWLRIVIFLSVSPIGGLVYTIARRYFYLYFDWQWYAGVTSVQMVLMAIPCMVVRSYGYSYCRLEFDEKHDTNSYTNDI